MWLLVLNENAGKGDGLNRLERFESMCKSNKIGYQIINESSESQTQKQISISLKTQTISTVIAFGGDGLVSICLQAIALKDVGLMVVPCGS